jgi:hypothetical protein
VTQDHDDFAFEPVPGLPERLPRGEVMLWQGSPEWRVLAVTGFHARKVAVYFAILLAWQVWQAWHAGESLAAIMVLALWVAGLALMSVCILCGLAYLYARGTIYTLTTKRIVIRTGLALPVTLNLPLSHIETASVGAHAGGTTSIALAVTKPNRIAWLVLWPNVRPWTFTNPQPLLRCLKDANALAPLLARALEADGGLPHRVSAQRGAEAAATTSQPVHSGTPQAA